MTADDVIRIRHMVDALHSAISFTRGRQREHLDTDTMLAFALVRAIEIVGEAATKVSIDTREQHPEVPCAAIVGMRHRLIHAYFDINHDILWTTATDAAPGLLPRLLAIVSAG
ncbi:DUF86 domain-containing protein [Elstera sp.]|jgi:uncharacterized protein with HEPN domain|uniref:DUF86 domain-containing protein n=1 Tax=Elstera sp. TaxID=1916664 RepID=UPI0037BE513E